MIIGIVLTLVHYIPGAEQAAPAELGIRMLVGPVPVLLIIMGIAVMSGYPITSNKYKEILNKINATDYSSFAALWRCCNSWTRMDYV